MIEASVKRTAGPSSSTRASDGGFGGDLRARQERCFLHLKRPSLRVTGSTPRSLRSKSRTCRTEERCAHRATMAF